MNILYDVIVVGSGAGGSAMANALTRRNLNVLLVEKGDHLPADGSTLDPAVVIGEGRFKSREAWRDRTDRVVTPEEYFNVGGKTKWYGAALARFPADTFSSDRSRSFRDWPFGGEALDPYYARAEEALGVKPFACEADLSRITRALTLRGWRSEPLPMGLAANIGEHSHEATHFDGFASVANLKSDAQVRFLEPVRASTNLRLITGHAVSGLIGAGAPAPRIVGVRLDDGRVYRARRVVLAAGALHSPRLLEQFLADHQLSWLPAARNVGRNLKLHVLTAMLAVGIGPIADQLRKTQLLLNDETPNSSVQPLGFDAELLATLIPKFAPRFVARTMARRAYGFFLQTEDGSHPHNRIVAQSATGRLPQIDYDVQRLPAAESEHRVLVRRLFGALFRAGMLAFSKRIGIEGTAHACGTLVAGVHAADSVVDGYGRVHGLDGVVVSDGSVLPRISRVNPALTIYAFALRAADHLADELANARAASSMEVVS